MGKAKLSHKGQVVIPAKLRKKYGIHPGSLVEIIDGGDRIVLRPAPKDPVEEAMGMLKARISLTDELLRARQEELALENQKDLRATAERQR